MIYFWELCSSSFDCRTSFFGFQKANSLELMVIESKCVQWKSGTMEIIHASSRYLPATDVKTFDCVRHFDSYVSRQRSRKRMHWLCTIIGKCVKRPNTQIMEDSNFTSPSELPIFRNVGAFWPFSVHVLCALQHCTFPPQPKHALISN